MGWCEEGDKNGGGVRKLRMMDSLIDKMIIMVKVVGEEGDN